MNEDLIDKAVGFLVAMRPADRRFESTRERDDHYRSEVCDYLQVTAALRMAGAPGRPLPADMLVRCAPCGWAGPAEQLRDGPLGQVYCPRCHGTQLERMP